MLLNPEHFQGKLVQWIKTELQMESLANQLVELLAKEHSFLEVLVTILQAEEYYTIEEIQAYIVKQETIKNLSEPERKKLKADSFLMYKRYLKAITIYDEVLQMQTEVEANPEILLDGTKPLERGFWGNVYHNKAVAQAKNMQLEEARSNFLTAFAMNEQDTSLQAYFMVLMCMHPMEEVRQEIDRLGVEEAEFGKIRVRVEDAMSDMQGSSMYKKYQQAQYNKQMGNMEDYNKRIDAILSQWKEEYREQTI